MGSPHLFLVTMTKQKNFLIQTAYYFTYACLFYLFFRYVFFWLLPFFIALFLTYILHQISLYLTFFLPLSAFFIRKTLFIISSIMILISLIYYGMHFFNFIIEILLKFPSFYESQLSLIIEKWQNHFDHPLYHFLIQKMNEQLASFSHRLLNYMAHLASTIPTFLFNLFLTFLFLLFLIFSLEEIIQFSHRFLNPKIIQKISHYQNSFQAITKKMALSMFKIWCITFSLLQISFYLLKIENSFQLALWISLADLIPAVGTSLFLIPYSLFSYFNHQPSFAFSLILLAILISLIHQFLEPRFLGKELGIPSIFMIIAMILATSLFGWIGFIIAPITLTLLIQYKIE